MGDIKITKDDLATLKEGDFVIVTAPAGLKGYHNNFTGPVFLVIGEMRTFEREEKEYSYLSLVHRVCPGNYSDSIPSDPEYIASKADRLVRQVDPEWAEYAKQFFKQ